MTTVVAQGTFDLLHPGHVHYLTEAATYGDELHVIVARGDNVTHKEPPILSNSQRRKMVDALAVVDEAVLGDDEDIFRPIREIDPDVIVLGHDQHHDESELEAALATNDIDCRVERASGSDPESLTEIHSSSAIVERTLRERDRARDIHDELSRDRLVM